MKSKWFSPYTRIKQKLLRNDVVEMPIGAGGNYELEEEGVNDEAEATEEVLEGEFGELDLIFAESDFEEHIAFNSSESFRPGGKAILPAGDDLADSGGETQDFRRQKLGGGHRISFTS